MASAALGSIFVDLLLRDSNFSSGLNNAKGATKSFADSLLDLNHALQGIAEVKVLEEVATSATSAAKAIQDSSDATGLTTTNYQKYAYAAQQAGVGSDVFQKAVEKLNQNILSGQAPYASTSQAFQQIADKVQAAKSPMDALGVVTDAFGAKLGARLLPALSGGSDGLKALGDEAQKAGIVLDASLVQQGKEVGDAIDGLGLAIKNNFDAGVLQQFGGSANDIKKIWTDPDFKAGIQAIGNLLGELVKLAAELASNFGAAAGVIKDVAGSLAPIKQLGGNGLFDNSPILNAITTPAQLLIGGSQALGGAIGNKLNGGSFSSPQLAQAKAVVDATNKQADAQANLNSLLAQFADDQKQAAIDAANAEAIAIKRAQERSDTIQGVTDKIVKQTQALQIQNNIGGGADDPHAKAQVAMQQAIFDLQNKGIDLSDQELQNLQAKSQALEGELTLQQEISDAKAYQDAIDKANIKANQEAMQSLDQNIKGIENTFGSALEGVINGTKSLKDAFNDVLEKIIESVTQLQIMKLIAASGLDSGGLSGSFIGDLLTGNTKSSLESPGGVDLSFLNGSVKSLIPSNNNPIPASGGSALSSIGDWFSSIFSFDVGTPFVPQDQIAKIHRGEMIIPKSQADKLRARGGGSNVTMNIYTQDASSFGKSQGQILSQTSLLMNRASRRNN